MLGGYPGATMHNGCAEGADESALELVAEGVMDWAEVVLWPCNKDRERFAIRWAKKHAAEVMPIEAPLTRNARMVAAASVVIACPDGPERVRSGTWSTVREARRMGRAVTIVWPSGEVTTENGSNDGT